MVEHIERDEFTSTLLDIFPDRRGCAIRFEYKKFRLISFKKVDNYWHITAGFEDYEVIGGRLQTVSMVIDDKTGEVTEMNQNT